MRPTELLLAWGSLGIVGALAFGHHILHGGIYLDDWADAAATLYPEDGGDLLSVLSYFNDFLSSCRPVLIVFLPLKYFIFGTHIKFLLVLSVGLAVLVAALAYAVLRVVGLPWYHAWLISGLTIVYPWYDSTRFWESASPLSLAIVFALGGLWLALVGLSRNSWRLHAVAAALYLLSMLTYETTLPLIAFAGLLYVAQTNWETARGRWGIDLLMVLIAGAWAKTHTPRAISDLSGDLDHLWQIVFHGGEMLARTLYPLGTQPHTGVALLALLGLAFAGAAVYMASSGKKDRAKGWDLHSWFLLLAAGLLIAALGWVMFVPADPYYTPSVFGFTNRVNGAAGFGLLLVAYSIFGVVGSMLGRLAGRPQVAIIATVTLGISLGAAYAHVLERHSRLWVQAYDTEMAIAGKIKAKFPNPPDGTTIFTSGHPAYLTLGVPVFAVSWDLDGMIRVLYKDGDLRAYPTTEELRLVCRPHGMRVQGEGERLPIAPYGTARLINIETGKTAKPIAQAACRSQLRNFLPGPLYQSTEY